jgi:3-methyl-2-oxobutanoate hydroxymethyltransferase
MPYQSYENEEQAVKNAKLFINEAGADAVKIEGNKPDIIQAILNEKIPVMGHIGLTPQTITEFKAQGKGKQSASRLLNDAIELERVGCFSIVLECVSRNLAKQITLFLLFLLIKLFFLKEKFGYSKIRNPHYWYRRRTRLRWTSSHL